MDQTTQNVSPAAYRGKIGFVERDEQALAKATAIVVRVLENAGHEVDRCRNRPAHRRVLDCDTYLIDLRHRRTPAPMRQADGLACNSALCLTLTPRYPDHTDEELSELLLARLLQALLLDLSATTVEWRETGLTLERDDFLSAFVPDGAQVSDQGPLCDIQIPVEIDDATPVARSPGPHSFAPVEQTAETLSRECDRMIDDRATPLPAMAATAGPSLIRNGLAWGLTAVLAVLAFPFGLAAAVVNLVRGGDMRFSLQMAAVLALLMVLQSSGLGNAAIQ
nr:hypothetical protein [Phaeobacter sp. HF9A]